MLVCRKPSVRGGGHWQPSVCCTPGIWRVLVRGWLGESSERGNHQAIYSSAMSPTCRRSALLAGLQNQAWGCVLGPGEKNCSGILPTWIFSDIGEAWPWLYIRTIELTRTSRGCEVADLWVLQLIDLTQNYKSGQLSGWWLSCFSRSMEPSQGHVK